MARPSKFNAIYKRDILQLYGEGYSLDRIASLCCISRNTLHLWIKKYGLKEEMETLRESTAKECIEVGLRKLASGSSEKTIQDKYITNKIIKKTIYNEETGENEEVEKVIPVERTSTLREKAPDSKAIEVLARKYYKDFDNKAEERELSSKILEGFTMRELQEARKDNPLNYIEADYKPVEEEDDEESVSD